MSKDKGKGKDKSIDLGSTPDELVYIMIDDQKKREWALKELVNKGSHHKQVLNAVILNRLNMLVRSIESKIGSAFVLQQGNEITIETHKHKMTLPIRVPISAGDGVKSDDILKAILHASEQEILMYAICLQAIEWGVAAIGVKK